MQLSEIPKTSYGIFIAVLASILNFEYSAKKNKKNEPHRLSISEVIESEKRGYVNA